MHKITSYRSHKQTWYDMIQAPRLVIPEASLVRVWWGQVQVRSPAGCDNVNIFWSHHPTQIFWNPASNQSKMIMYVNDASNLLDSKKRLQKLKYGWNTIVARSLQLRCDNCSVHSYGGHTLNFGDVDDVHDWKHVTWIWQETCRRRSLGISIMPLLRLIKLIELLTVQSGSCIRHTTEERSVISIHWRFCRGNKMLLCIWWHDKISFSPKISAKEIILAISLV